MLATHERAALAALKLDFARLAAGDLDAAIGCLRALLYAPPEQVLGPAATASGVRGVRPQALRGLLAEHLAAREREAALAVGMARLGDIRDATSLAVQGQYEAAPYPRWRSIARPDSDAMRQRLGDHVASARLAFMARPFRVLVAGCGTGQHAALATLGYGRDATITALDLSRASLAYGQRMCEALRVPPARFVQGDILDCGLLDGPFDIIESVGVLHHMADPFAGWRALLGCLAPGGLMLIGLYSARARADIATRRSEPDYPGADCDDDAARAYRARLMAREQAAGVRALTRSRDFYALAAFRDLLLHRSERRMTIGEIGAFLAAEGLVFRGFSVTPETRAAFEQAFPHATWPGRLETWDAFEVAHPSTFEGMYQFWCERKDPP